MQTDLDQNTQQKLPTSVENYTAFVDQYALEQAELIKRLTDVAQLNVYGNAQNDRNYDYDRIRQMRALNDELLRVIDQTNAAIQALSTLLRYQQMQWFTPHTWR